MLEVLCCTPTGMGSPSLPLEVRQMSLTQAHPMRRKKGTECGGGLRTQHPGYSHSMFLSILEPAALEAFQDTSQTLLCTSTPDLYSQAASDSKGWM